MFDWFKNKEKDNVVPFSDHRNPGADDKASPHSPEYNTEPKKPAQTFYRLGLTDDNRVSLLMGYSEITMTARGVDNLIEQLELFRNQLATESDE